ARSLVLGRLRLVAGPWRPWGGAGRHVGPFRLGPAGSGDRDRFCEGLGGGARQAAQPRGLDLLDPLGLGAAALTLELGMPRHDPSFRCTANGRRTSVPEVDAETVHREAKPPW